METLNIKEEARRLIDKLPENCTWDDLMYAIYNGSRAILATRESVVVNIPKLDIFSLNVLHLVAFSVISINLSSAIVLNIPN